MMDRIEVHVVHRVTYTFPSLEARCSAHGQSLCVLCARNPGTCGDDPDSEGFDHTRGRGCGVWSETGMHWDTCPNRITGPLEQTP